MVKFTYLPEFSTKGDETLVIIKPCRILYSDKIVAGASNGYKAIIINSFEVAQV